ncbi:MULTISPECIES: peptidylprolyl isomerase [unclassified Iodidimonas]|jgi:peptidylprolyl isomerase|uniref:peptidylprolyl isomerase n=1 Tax=unclassified Iodidimonas TaxID=2626145 RepID=UPI0024826D62|nr:MULTISPECIES: peptidylprolyl isomerase [unclassified Iodidimonas]
MVAQAFKAGLVFRGALAAFCLIVSGAMMPAAAQDDVWRPLDPENALYLEMERGRVIIELAPDLAPQNVAQLKKLVREGRYENSSFYRVIENFVAQAGLQGRADDIAPVVAEFEWDVGRLDGFSPIETDDPYAPITGFYKGFPLGRDAGMAREWAIHCPAVMAMARGNEAGSATSEFYINIGQAPRHLDRNLTVIGRVLMGMRFIEGAHRGNRDINGGVIADRMLQTPIKSMAIAADLPPAERTRLEVINTSHPRFLAQVEALRNRTGDFWKHRPSGMIDICTVPVSIRPGN